MEEEEEEYTQCPRCYANWGIEEMSFQQCDCCGYPYNDDDDEGFYFFDEEEEF